MNQAFLDFIDHLDSLGYEADNEDLSLLDACAGNGCVTFYSGKVEFALLFSDWKLDLNGQGHVVVFKRRFKIKTDIRPNFLELKGADYEFQAEMRSIVLHDRLELVIRNSVEALNQIEIQ